ncbi:hypothetical protein D3C78_1665720 [compost metagenome]
MACSQSSIWISLRSLRAAIRADSLARFIRSAPVKPGVRRASTLRSTSEPRGLFFMWTLRIDSRPATSGASTTTWRSKRPGRNSAESRMSGRLVAAMTTTLTLASKPSISTKSWLRVCSRSS